MPATITEAKTAGLYRVSTPNGVKAKGTSLRKAKRLRRLLNAVEYGGWRPTGKKT